MPDICSAEIEELNCFISEGSKPNEWLFDFIPANHTHGFGWNRNYADKAIPDYENPIKTWDAQDNIDKCLNCTRSVCCNCLSPKFKQKSTKNRVDDTVLIQLIAEGDYSTVEIAAYFSVPVRTARHHISKLKGSVNA